MMDRWAKLVPELLVTDISASLKFWVDICGFAVLYSRMEEGFAYLDYEGAQVMLEEQGGRNWVTGPLVTPFGRGVNFQITVSSIEPLLAALSDAGWPLYMAPEEKWYRSNAVELGVRQFLVQDPDGYLVRFLVGIGERTHATDVSSE